MRSTTLIATVAAAAFMASSASAAVVINEIHYDNTGTDSGEFIEIVLTAGESPADVDVELYNGNGGGTYNSFNLMTDFTAHGILGDGNDYYSLSLPSNGIQNGAPDGLATALSGILQEFLSYEGTMTGTSGFANGVMSTDIGVSQSSGTPLGSSLQRLLLGSTWLVTDGSNTQGAINVVPAPGVLALFGLAAVAGRRRRRA